MNSAIKGLFILTLSSLCLTACGGDSSGSTKAVDDETESSESGALARDRSSSSWAMSSATTVVDADAKEVVEALQAQGILALTAGPHVVRFLPPLVLKESDLEEAVDMISDALDCTFGE